MARLLRKAMQMGMEQEISVRFRVAKISRENLQASHIFFTYSE